MDDSRDASESLAGALGGRPGSTTPSTRCTSPGRPDCHRRRPAAACCCRGDVGPGRAERSAWSPLRISAFRALWLAQLGSMIGTWMQTVGAQWLLVDEPNASALVSLVQTAGLLPMLLLALPAGVLADAFDRRRLLVGVQLATFVVGVILAVLALTSDLSPAVLLTFTFLLGAGAAISMPPWQALIPDIVPRDDIRGAAALGAVSVNLARAVGPAVAGFLITQFPVGVVFAINAATYGVMALVVLRCAPRGRLSAVLPERFVPHLRARPTTSGTRRSSAACSLRSAALRAARVPRCGRCSPWWPPSDWGSARGVTACCSPRSGSAPWVARPCCPSRPPDVHQPAGVRRDHRLRRGAQAEVVLVGNLATVVVLLLPARAWLAVLSTLGAVTQVFLPSWVRARGLSMQQIVFMGELAGRGGADLGDRGGVRRRLVATFAAASVLMALGAATIVVLPLHNVEGLDRSTAVYWPDPELVDEPDPDEGPVLITTVTVQPGTSMRSSTR